MSGTLTHPQNFLFDPNGHIKLSDFGLAYVLDIWISGIVSDIPPERICIGLMIRLVRGSHFEQGSDSTKFLDYEQQRRDLLRKHGIDLEDGNGDTTKTKRMDRREADRIMGDGPGGLFTWREKNRKKVCG